MYQIGCIWDKLQSPSYTYNINVSVCSINRLHAVHLGPRHWKAWPRLTGVPLQGYRHYPILDNCFVNGLQKEPLKHVHELTRQSVEPDFFLRFNRVPNTLLQLLCRYISHNKEWYQLSFNDERMGSFKEETEKISKVNEDKYKH